MRRTLITLVAACVAATVVLFSGAAAGAKTLKPCTPAQLSAVLKAGSPGAGQRYATLTLTNKSKRACEIAGYVGLGLRNSAGKAVVTHVVRTDKRGATRFALDPRDGAFTQLHWSPVQGTADKPGGPCFKAPRQLRVTPPNDRSYLTLAWKLGTVCEAGRIDITPLALLRP